MFKTRIRKLAATMLVGVIISTGAISSVKASEITSGTWSLYYNSVGSYKKTDTVVLTATSGRTYTATCNHLSSNLTVGVSNTYISMNSPSFTAPGSKSFTFANSVSGTNQNVKFSLGNSGKYTGSASGSAKRN